MPLVPQDLPTGGVANIPERAPEGPGPSFLDTAAAAERQSNVLSSLYDRLNSPKPDVAPVPGFDPLGHVPAGYESYASRFLSASSPEEVAWTKQRVDAEVNDRNVLARAGKGGFAASLVSGATDPLTLASMLIPGGGETRLANAARMALINAGTSAAQEGLLHELSVTRTPEESMFNVAGSAVLGGILGPIHAPARSVNSLGSRLSRELHSTDTKPTVLGPTERTLLDQPLPSDVPENIGGDMPINPGMESTAGASAVHQPTLESERIARGAQTLAEGGIGHVAPGLRILKSDSLEARKLVQELVNTPEMLEKNYEGVATAQPIERELWKQEGVWYQGLKARGEAFQEYRERTAGQPDQLSRSEFGQEVSGAMRNGDQHVIPEVAKAASETRRLVFDPWKERAQAQGLLPENVKAQGADSYLTRQYDARAIRENMKGWLDTLTEGFKGQGLEGPEARDIAYQVTRQVLGSERAHMDFHVTDGIVPKSGRLQERTLNLPDKELSPFLNSDIDTLSHAYLRTMAPEVLFHERFGSRDMADRLGDVKDEYARLMEKAQAEGKDPAILEKQMNGVLRDLTALRDRLYGTYGNPKDPGHFAVRAGRVLRSVNALRLLGSATLAHFPDLANVVVRYGMPKTFAAIGKVLTSTSAMKLTSREAKRMGAALDMTMNLTASVLGDYGSHSQFAEQRAMAKATRFFTIATGETPLITAVQSLTSTLAQHEILGVAQKVANGSAVGANRMAKLAASGLDRDMLLQIAKEGEAHSQTVNGLRFGMSDQWTNKAAQEAFESAVLKEAHGVTLRPGAGDTPLLMSGELGKTLMQFKTFGFAASRIVVNPLLQGLAHGDINAVQGMFALAFMGTAAYAAKQIAAGQPLELDNPTRLAAEVLDKSNLMGWTSDAFFPLMSQFGMKDLSRWSDRDPVETLLGPSIGMLADIYSRQLPAKFTAPDEETEGQTNKPFARSDLHFLRRLAPGQNLWYFRRGVNALEDAVGDMFDLPGQSNADRAERISLQ